VTVESGDLVVFTRSSRKTSSSIDDRLATVLAQGHVSTGPTVRRYNSQPWTERTPWSVLPTMNVV